MLDLKTLKTIDEALDIALANLVEENALKEDSPYVQRFVHAQKKVHFEIEKHKKNNTTLIAKKCARARN